MVEYPGRCLPLCALRAVVGHSFSRCGICRQNMSLGDGRDTKTLPRGHKFHSSCVTRHAASDDADWWLCPVCKRPISAARGGRREERRRRTRGRNHDAWATDATPATLAMNAFEDSVSGPQYRRHRTTHHRDLYCYDRDARRAKSKRFANVKRAVVDTAQQAGERGRTVAFGGGASAGGTGGGGSW